MSCRATVTSVSTANAAIASALALLALPCCSGAFESNGDAGTAPPDASPSREMVRLSVPDTRQLDAAPPSDLERDFASGVALRDAEQDGADSLADLSPVAFSDVSTSHPQYEAIQWVAQRGIMEGSSETPPTFNPDSPILRDRVAATLVRMMHGETFTFTASPYFTDVPVFHWAFKYVQRIKDEAITAGCGDGKYCPARPTRRDEAAVFIARAKFGWAFTYSPNPHFVDVPATHWAFAAIQKLFEDGITAGYGGGQFRPDVEMTRAHWALFLYRAGSL